MDRTHIFQLLKKLTEGNLSELEYAELADYVKKSETDPVIYEFMDDFWSSQDAFESYTKLQAEQVYKEILKTPGFKPNRLQFRSIWGTGYLKIAVSIVIFCALFLAGYKFGQFEKNKKTHFIQYSATAKQLLKKKLPDGSVVWLNAGSSIKFEDNFNQDTRDLYLSGEAYFDVTHNPQKPFNVHTGQIKTQVLGTAFNVRAYNDSKIQVTVARGKVRVSDGDEQLGLLTKNKQLDYNVQTHSIRERIVNAGTSVSWTTGELVFDDITLLEASEIMSRWYNVRFVFGNQKLKNCRFVLSFKNTVPVNQVMDVLSRLNDFDYKLNDNLITVNATDCNCE